MDLSIIAKMAGLLIPLAGIALPVVIIMVVLHYRQQQREKLYETVKHFADRGMPVPKELLDPPRPPQRTDISSTARFRAITLIGTGVGLALMFWMLDLAYLSGIGGLLLCIGAAQLVAVGLDRKANAVVPANADDGQARG